MEDPTFFLRADLKKAEADKSMIFDEAVRQKHRAIAAEEDREVLIKALKTVMPVVASVCPPIEYEQCRAALARVQE